MNELLGVALVSVLYGIVILAVIRFGVAWSARPKRGMATVLHKMNAIFEQQESQKGETGSDPMVVFGLRKGQKTLRCSAEIYDALQEGMMGVITWKGNQLLRFE